MRPDPLEVSLQGQAPTITIVLRGQLTSPSDDAVTDAYRQATAQGARNILIDFARVEHMDTSGIGQIISILTETRRAGQRLIFVGLIPRLQKVLTMMGLTRYADVCATMADAQELLGSGE